MTLQKSSLLIIFVILGVLFIVVFLLYSENPCGIQHVILINDLKNYEQTLDPEFCEMLVDKIDSFNEQCMPKIEILDCG